MLKIVEIKNEEQFNQIRNIEKSDKFDYLYLLKYCNQIKLSDNGELKNFSGIVYCKTEEEYNKIQNKENVLYIVGQKIYFNNTPILSQTTEQEIEDAIDETINELKEHIE
jgi:hypothetical protein